MFKSIEYLRYDQETNYYIYKLIDSEFECEIKILGDMAMNEGLRTITIMVLLPTITILEYQKRNLPILINIFKCNLYLSETCKISHEAMLEFQNISIDKSYQDINFSEKYYPKLKEMWDKYKLYL